MKQPKRKRTAAQAAASSAWASAGRAAQARKRAYNIAHHLPTRTRAQTQASQRWAAAGQAALARKRAHLPPLPKKTPALAGVPGGAGVLGLLAEANRVLPCCAATAVASHLYLTRGIIASQEDVLGLHLAAGGDDEHGAAIPSLLEIASGSFAGTRLARFWRVDDQDLPGIVAGLRLPGGTHAVLMLGAACVSWGRITAVPGQATEMWWAEWEDAG